MCLTCPSSPWPQKLSQGASCCGSSPFYRGLVSAYPIPCRVVFTLCLQVLVVSLCIFLLCLATPGTPYSLCLQVLVVSLCIFLLSLADTYYPYSRGALLTSCVVLYALTAGFAGYTSSVQYKLMNGDNWVSQMARSLSGNCPCILQAPSA